MAVFTSVHFGEVVPPKTAPIKMYPSSGPVEFNINFQVSAESFFKTQFQSFEEFKQIFLHNIFSFPKTK
ncbi:MAG: hypothetical protein AAB556_00975 [Patescibacteria group bacterium]